MQRTTSTSSASSSTSTSASTSAAPSTAPKLVFAEVTRNRMTRQLEDSVWIKFVNTTNRRLYAVEVLELEPEQELDQEQTRHTQVRGGGELPGVSYYLPVRDL